MSELARLQEHIVDGSIRIINMIGVPRSVSTALGRSLNEADELSIFINEPFNRNNRDIEVAASSVMETAETVLDTADSPLTIITKNMSTYLSPEAYQELEGLSEGQVWSVRDPLIQMGSLVTRIANDIAIETGADKVTQSTALPYLNEVDSFLRKSNLSTGYSRTGWSSIGSHYSNIANPERSIVIDGDELTVNPVRVLKEACKKIKLGFTPNMIEGWDSDYTNVNVGSSRFRTSENAWTKHAATSSGIVATQRQPLGLETLPATMRKHITEVAIPTYEEMRKPH